MTDRAARRFRDRPEIAPAPDATTSIAALRRISSYLSDTGHPDGAWFAACLAEYEAGARFGLTVADALGFRLGPGESPWWECEALARRDTLLQAIAARHFSALGARPAATALMQELARYEASGWRRHRGNLLPPVTLTPLQCDLFALLKLRAPVSFGTVRRALAHQIPVFVSHGLVDAAVPSE
jgi:hypothetical protein